VRISAINGSPELRISFVENPDEGDQVAEAYGMAYAVAPEVADLVGDAILDLEQGDETGFVLRTN
jgi:lipopolysaccharide export system protein LptA